MTSRSYVSEGRQPYDHRVYPRTVSISSPKSARNPRAVRRRIHHQRCWGFVAPRGGKADEHHRPIREVLSGLSGSGAGGTRGGRVVGATDLRIGIGLRGFKRSRGVATRSVVGGAGGEGGSDRGTAATGARSGHRAGGQEHAEPDGTGGSEVGRSGAV